jgi:hypothetical protein
MTTRLKFGLLDNALDYLLKAAEHARQNSPRDAKYALVHLSTGIELLLKARLSQEHWALLFSNPDIATKQALESGDFVSVDAVVAIKRLCNISGCTISSEDLKHLRSLREHRNRAQHFAIDVEKAAAISMVAKSFDFSIRFIRAQVGALLDARGHEQVGEVLRALSDFEGFVQVRLRTASTTIAGAKKLVNCPDCWQDFLELGGGRNPKCHFCGYTDSAQAVAERAALEEVGIVQCPVCRAANAMRCTYFEVTSRWLCFACGEEGCFDFCENETCKNVVSDADPNRFCPDCTTKKIAEASISATTPPDRVSS